MSAADYIELQQARRDWIARIEHALQGFDAVLSPTVPIVAPPDRRACAPGAARDEAFFRINGLLLRNPSVVNMLDGCAISLPCHAPDELPVGLMVWQGAMRDDVGPEHCAADRRPAASCNNNNPLSGRPSRWAGTLCRFMKIAVIGAGIIGVTTAWELARDGHEVTVFERRIATAEEGSFANAGLVAPGYIGPWAAPGMPFKILRHLLARHAPVRFSLPLTGSDLAWMWKCWRACSVETHRAQPPKPAGPGRLQPRPPARTQRRTGVRVRPQQGLLVLLRSERDQALLRPGLQLLRDQGIAHRELSPEEARSIEPALNPDTVFHGALHLPDDEAGNCRQFALLLKNAALARGVQFAFSSHGRTSDTRRRACRCSWPAKRSRAASTPPCSAPASTRRACCARWA